MRMRQFASWMLAPIIAIAVTIQTGCSIPTAANASGAGGAQPGDSANGPQGGLADAARSPLGGAVDLDSLTVGDLVVFALPGRTGVDPRTGLPTCVCDWTVEPPSAGVFEPPRGCSTAYTVAESGPAVISVEESCDGATPERSTQAVAAFLAPANLSNLAPIADAGADRNVQEGDTVVLDGRESFDPDGDALTYQWAQIGGLGVTLIGAHSPLASFATPDVLTNVDLRFRLTVADPDAAADVAMVVIDVANVAETAVSVTADAGPDQQVLAGQSVVLNGQGGSTSGDGSLSFAWTQVFGPPVDLNGVTQATAAFVAPDAAAQGELLVFRLTVSAEADSTSDDVVVQVFNELPPDDDDPADDPSDDGLIGDRPPDDPPGAGGVFATDGATSTAVDAPVTITLTGGDADGNPLTFSIEKQPCDGTLGQVVPATPQSATVVYTPDAGFHGTERFSFTAFDGQATSLPAVYTVTVGGPKPFRAVFGGSNFDLLDNGTVDAWIDDGMRRMGIKMNGLRAPVSGSDRIRIQRFTEPFAAVDGTIWTLFNWYSVLEADWLPNTEPYVSDAGVTYPNAPCPQSDNIWDNGVTPRFVALAKLTDPTAPEYMPGVGPYIEGIILDPELYASPSLSNYPAPCHCTNCFLRFFEQQGISDPVPPAAQRAAFLQSLGLASAYEEFELAGVRAHAAAAREAVHAVNPCMKIGGTGVVRFDRSPFYPGVAEGLGVKEAPLYEFSQFTFHTGYSGTVVNLQQQVMSAGLHVQLNMGLFMPPIPPDALTDHFYTLATRADGVFVNGTAHYDNLAVFLCFPVSQYRQAVAAANAEVDLYEADPDYVSQYTGAPFVPACVNTLPYGFPLGLLPLESGPPAAEGVTIRDETAYYFHATAGDAVAFDVYLREFGNSDPGAGWWILLGPDGDTLDSAAFTEATSPSLVNVAAPQTGVHTLIVRPSFVHGFHIENASHPGAYFDAVEDNTLSLFRAHLLQPEPQLYAYVPPGVTVVGVRMSAGFGEPSQVIIHDERDLANPLFDDVIGDTPGDQVETQFTLPLGNDAAGEGVVLEVRLRNPGGAEDLNLGFTEGALPYLSQTRSGLFRTP